MHLSNVNPRNISRRQLCFRSLQDSNRYAGQALALQASQEIEATLAPARKHTNAGTEVCPMPQNQPRERGQSLDLSILSYRVWNLHRPQLIFSKSSCTCVT